MESTTTPISTESTSRPTEAEWPGRFTCYPNEQKWLESRRHSIGASEAYSVISGHGAAEVWLSKTRPEEAESPVTELDSDIGHAFEPVAAKWFAREHGAEVIDPGDYTVWYDPDCPIITSTPDFLAIGRDGRRFVLEAKTFSRWMRPVGASPFSGWDERAPYKHATQVGQQIVATGLDHGVLYGIASDEYPRVPGRATITHWIDGSDRFRDFLRETLSTWWDRYVRTDTMPPARPDPSAERVLRILFPRPVEAKVYSFPSDLDSLVERWDAIEAEKKNLEDERGEIKREVMQRAGDAEEIRGAEDDAKLWTWRLTKKGRQFRRSSGRKREEA